MVLGANQRSLSMALGANQRHLSMALGGNQHPHSMALSANQRDLSMMVGANQHRLSMALNANRRHLSTSSSGEISGEDRPGAVDAEGSAHRTLQDSLDKLVNAAVELVEKDNLPAAVDVLTQGIDIIGSAFPDSPELGELHNQCAVLRLAQGEVGEAVTSARAALDITSRAFGATSPLTAHRQLRLGSALFAQGHVTDAVEALTSALTVLQSSPVPVPAPPSPRGTEQGSTRRDYGVAEASFYLALARAGGDAAALKEAEPQILDNFRELKALVGGGSLITSLALSQHSRMLHGALEGGFELSEVYFKQHIRLQEIVDPTGVDLGLVQYQLATYYYVHDLLTDAGVLARAAANTLRPHFGDEHDLLLLCKHRLGMVCAASRDAESARKLLTNTRERYRQQDEAHALAHEAAFGLGLARIKSLDVRLDAAARRAEVAEVLTGMKADLEGMARALGSQHLLVQGAARHHAQAQVFAQR